MLQECIPQTLPSILIHGKSRQQQMISLKTLESFQLSQIMGK